MKPTCVLAAAILAAACGGRAPASQDAAPRPDERRAIGPAPVIAETKPKKAPLEILAEGDVVEVVRPAGHLAWAHGELRREGDVVEVRRTAGDGVAFAFAADLAPAMAMPAAEELCADAPDCRSRLRRAVVADGVVAWEVCAGRPCRFFRLRGAVREVWSVDGVTSVRRAAAQGRPLLLVTRHFTRAPGHTSSEVVALPLDGPFAPVLRVPADEVDARGERVRQRLGEVSVEGNQLVFRGTVREVAADGRELSVSTIVEGHPLP